MEGEMDMRDDLESFNDDTDETEDDELKASGMHVEGDDDEMPMEEDR